jgi:hypothetical protein
VETFVVRIFVPANDEKLELTGIVEHSGTGRSTQFRGTEGLVRAVLRQLELGAHGPESHGSQQEEAS